MLDDAPIKVKKEEIHFIGSSCISLNNHDKAVVDSLPYRSYLKDKGVNGMMDYWRPFSEGYFVSTMRTTIASDYGDQITAVRYFFYEVKTRGFTQLPLVVNLKDFGVQGDAGQKFDDVVTKVAEFVEKPIQISILPDGRRGLTMPLPQSEEREAGQFLVIPKL